MLQQSLEFHLIQNSLETEDLPLLKDLIQLKCLYSKQLTKMPREYLIKLLFDACHQSLVIKNEIEIVAGLTFRSFDHEKFYEIAFVAVKQSEKSKGIGSLLMNKFKNLTQERNIRHIFTFADNGAIGFFEKHGFSKNITLPKENYLPYVKQYVGGKLMECKLDLEINLNFENLNDLLEENKNKIIEKVKSLIGMASYDIEKSTKIISKFNDKELLIEELIEFIPGLKEVNKFKENEKEEEKKLTLNFLLYCQNFLELAFNKSTLLKDNIAECEEKKNVDEKELEKRRQLLFSYRCLLHEVQIMLLHGDFKYKDQFIKYITEKLNKIMGPEEALKGKEREFMNKIKSLSYEFMKNQISFDSIEKKYKLQNK